MQHLAKPTLVDLNAAKNVLRYLKGTANRNLVFRKSEKGLNRTGFCDADLGAWEDRRSITGYCFRLSNDGALAPVTGWHTTNPQIGMLWERDWNVSCLS